MFYKSDRANEKGGPFGPPSIVKSGDYVFGIHQT